jgi:hypothetical protein
MLSSAMILCDEATASEAKTVIEAARAEGNLISCLNPSHTATIAVCEQKFGISVEIPNKAPQVCFATRGHPDHLDTFRASSP